MLDSSVAWRLIGSIGILLFVIGRAKGEEPPARAAAVQELGPFKLPPTEAKSLESWPCALALDTASQL